MSSAEDKKTKGQPGAAALSIERRAVPELLAPAGSVAAAKGAYAAGADAVYIGGKAFSARAFADNADTDELCGLIEYARLFDKKLYLACNILTKDGEFEAVFRMLDPLYEHGLHGVIVQDVGALAAFHKRYPELKLHASTQMGVMSGAGIEWLKGLGVSRVVPARELSIEEIRELNSCGMELECFIHGAMCYSYSGRCLLSSLAGGRSGNRGRCAGPCRKAYSLNGGEPRYYLSMKDMCAVNSLPELAGAGVASLKIEGRMKAPEYAALVTSVYRKYLDRYAAGENARPEPEDIKALEQMYLRSERQEGYLHKANGKSMISLSSPGYAKVSEEEKEKTRRKYLDEPMKLPVDMELYLNAGEEICLMLRAKYSVVSVSGVVAEEAKKQPLGVEDIKKQLTKTGNTAYKLHDCVIDTDGGSFVPVGALNALRREGLEALTRELCPQRNINPAQALSGMRQWRSEGCSVIAGVSNAVQFETVVDICALDGVILELDEFIKRPGEYSDKLAAAGKKLYLRLPGIVRQKWIKEISLRLKKAVEYEPDGIYCGSIDALALAGSYVAKEGIIADQGLYVFNRNTEEELGELNGYTVSAELSYKEALCLARRDKAEWIVYGRTPLMYSANCVYKTDKGCEPQAGFAVLTDELGHAFPVRPVHEYCVNVLYNCVPLMLYEESLKIREAGFRALRLEFTNETAGEMKRILNAYVKLLSGDETAPVPVVDFTRGHYKKGVE